MPRPKKYDWDDKRDICWKLYDEDKLSGPEIVQYFVKHFNVPQSELPRANQFFAQFRKWGFPPRRPYFTPEQEAKCVARIRELYNQNLQAQEILDVLNDEDWALDQYRYARLRRKNGMIKRFVPPDSIWQNKPKKRKRTEGEAEDGGDAQHEVDRAEGLGSPADLGGAQQSAPLPLPPEEATRRAQRLADLQVESDQLMQTRKRRRRIRGHGLLPADAPGMEPRYKSETSLDECKAFLHTDNDVYMSIRREFEAICRTQGISRMSDCAEGQWQAAKDKLVRENVHLSSVLHPLQGDLEKKDIALNCICCDVTKKIRSSSNTMTMAQANNLLGLDPLQSKDLRHQLHEILEANYFTTVAAFGRERLDELSEQWYAQSELLTRVKAENDPLKIRAVGILNRDARKRFGEDPAKNPIRPQKQKIYGPGPGPAKNTVRTRRGFPTAAIAPTDNPNNTAIQNNDSISSDSGQTTSYGTASRRQIAPVGPARNGHQVPNFHSTTIADMVPHVNFDLDPTLANFSQPRVGPIWPPPAAGGGHGFSMFGIAEAAGQSQSNNASTSTTHAAPVSIPAYFRLDPASTLIGHHPRMWLGKLNSKSVAAVERAATAKAGAAKVGKIHGIAKNADGSEDSWLIENDDELEVYLDEAGEKATFVVVLQGGYA